VVGCGAAPSQDLDLGGCRAGGRAGAASTVLVGPPQGRVGAGGS
jgi:hypothetical protein